MRTGVTVRKECVSLLRSVMGVGEKTAAAFHRLGLDTTEELLRYYPRSYIHYEEPRQIAQCTGSGVAAICGVVAKTPELLSRGPLTILSTVIQDESGRMACKWFHMPYLKSRLPYGARYVFRGRYAQRRGIVTMEQPELFSLAEYEERAGSYHPVYPLTGGLTNKTVQRTVRAILSESAQQEDYLPEQLRKSWELLPEREAFQGIHYPENEEQLRRARKRLVFDEFFLFSLAVRLEKQGAGTEKNECPIRRFSDAEQLLSRLPYELTGAQKRIWEELKTDLSGEMRMNRLIQGDVGSGKTILAFLALLSATEEGAQAALMAPTVVLARQHYENLTRLLEESGLSRHILLLTGGGKASEKREAYRRLATGEVDIVIGTHAVIQERVEFACLSLVITDEQHRFGVRQRERLSGKGQLPHILVMSATPIPRTLALILYADLNISVLDELPAGRIPIKNCVVRPDFRENAYRFIEKELRAGHQAYLICPMVEPGEEEAELASVVEETERLTKRLAPDFRVEMLHGRLRSQEKNEVMQRFAAQEIDLLVSTTVIEVGVDVPNATVMMIENAERFGLAQLHQLRGRIGRGKAASYCIFVDAGEKQEDNERLQLLARSNDGFAIAAEDLRLRGPGEFFGVRQSGASAFVLGDVYADAALLQQAAEAAGRVLAEDPKLETERFAGIRRRVTEYGGVLRGRVNL